MLGGDSGHRQEQPLACFGLERNGFLAGGLAIAGVVVFIDSYERHPPRALVAAAVEALFQGDRHVFVFALGENLQEVNAILPRHRVSLGAIDFGLARCGLDGRQRHGEDVFAFASAGIEIGLLEDVVHRHQLRGEATDFVAEVLHRVLAELFLLLVEAKEGLDRVFQRAIVLLAVFRPQIDHQLMGELGILGEMLQPHPRRVAVATPVEVLVHIFEVSHDACVVAGDELMGLPVGVGLPERAHHGIAMEPAHIQLHHVAEFVGDHRRTLAQSVGMNHDRSRAKRPARLVLGQARVGEKDVDLIQA